MAGNDYTLAVEPHIARLRERSSIAASAHHAGVPEPFVDALAIQIVTAYCFARVAA